MNTKYLLLWFEAPLQSWGYDSKFGRRETLDFPTKSGVLGLLFCALGKGGEQTELLSRFSELKQTVFSFKKFKENKKDEETKIEIKKTANLHDFQMIGSGYIPKKSKPSYFNNIDDNFIKWFGFMIPHTSVEKNNGFSTDSDSNIAGTKLTHRYYLQDCAFAVALEVPCDLAEECENALKNPVWEISLGRKCCVPSEMIFQGTFDDLKSLLDSESLKKLVLADSEKVSRKERLVCDFAVFDENDSIVESIFSDEDEISISDEKYAFANDDSFTLNDIPLQFGTEKKYKDRRVKKITLENLSIK